MADDFCPECESSCDPWEKVWVNDRYGIPYRKVCFDCEDKVRAEIEDWVFDAEDADESLDQGY